MFGAGASYSTEIQRDRWSFEMGPIRPPSEGQDSSLLIRATRNCPWNRCHFCTTYKGHQFEYRSVAAVKQDIDTAQVLAQELKAASWRAGYGGQVNDAIIAAVVRGNPQIYGNNAADQKERQARLQSLVTVGRWLASGARTVFLQDGNTPVMRTPELVEVLNYLKQAFPTIERVTSYGRSKTAAHKSLEEWRAIKEAGLSRLHVGLESGCDEVLQFMDKGATAEEHVCGGRKVVEAGISLSEYVMPGLGGRRWSQKHALDTARVLNQIGPDFIRLRSLVVRRGSPLDSRMIAGEFETLSEDEVVTEVRLLVENLDCRSYLASDQMSNLLWEVEGQLPQDKARLLAIIDRYLRLQPLERLDYRLKKRLGSYLSIYGGLDAALEKKVEDALQSLRMAAPDAPARVDAAIAALKQGFV